MVLGIQSRDTQNQGKIPTLESYPQSSTNILKSKTLEIRFQLRYLVKEKKRGEKSPHPHIEFSTENNHFEY